jgi:hypothetical protein
LSYAARVEKSKCFYLKIASIDGLGPASSKSNLVETVERGEPTPK